MAERAGWDAVGYGIGGGFERDRTERERIQKLDAAKEGLQYDPTSQQYVPMPGSDQDLLKQQNLMLKQQLEEVQKGITTSNQWASIADGVQTGSYESFNEQISSNPMLAKVFKEGMGVHAVRELSPYDNERQLNAYTQAGMNPEVIDYLRTQRDSLLAGKATDMSQDDYLQAMKQIGTAYPLVEKVDGKLEATSLDQFLAATNLVKSSVRTEERKSVFDAIAMGKQALTGVTDRAYKLNLATKEQVAREAEMKTSAAEAKQPLNNERTQVMLDAVKSRDPKKVMEALKITDPEKFLKLTRGESGKMDSLTQFLTSMEMAGIGPEEQQQYLAKWVNKSVAGVGYNKEDMNVEQLTGSRSDAKSLFTPQASSMSKEQWSTKSREVQDNILSNLQDQEKSAALKATEKLEANHLMATGIEKLLTQALPKVDKDAIANAKTYVLSLTGIENKQAFANIDFNTRAGMLLAGYIKAMSGTAASDTEVTRLLNSLEAGKLSDETYIKQSMQSFSKQLRADNNNLGKMYIDVMPYTIGKTTNLRPKSSQQRSNPADVTNPKSQYYLPPLPPKSTSSNSSTKQERKPLSAF